MEANRDGIHAYGYMGSRAQALPAGWRAHPGGAGPEDQLFDVPHQPGLVYSLLQTETYALALLEGDAAARLKRQQILSRLEPPTLHVVLDETVLWREVGGAKVMYDQLMHLVDISSRNIKIQILPNNANIVIQGPLVMATLEDGSAAAYLETSVRGLMTISPDDLARATEVWESVLAAALPIEMSKELIKRTAEERWAS